MAEKKTKPVETVETEEPFVEPEPVDLKKYWAERVPFRAFRDSGKYKDDITVGWNGRTYLIQRGVEVMIPRAVREILYQSEEQDTRTAALIDQKTNEYRAESRRYE